MLNPTQLQQVKNYNTSSGPASTSPMSVEQAKASFSGSSTSNSSNPGYFSRVGSDIKTGFENAGASERASVEGTENPLKTGVDIAKNISHAGASVLTELPGVKKVGEAFGKIGQKIVDLNDKTHGAFGFPTTDNIAKMASPETLKIASDLAETGLNVAGIEGGVEGAKALPEVISKGTDIAKATVDKTLDTAKNIKEKVAPTETTSQTVGKVLQGKTKDIAPGTRALGDLDTSSVKTYKDLNKVSGDKISELAKQQDEKLSQDKTPHKLSEFEKTVGEGDNAVKINYVKEALDNLKELYASTRDAEGMTKINELESKANGGGLTTQEVNQLARDYGFEFGNKAFGKVNKEPLTGVNAQRFENTRTGLKDTARDLLPDDESRNLDARMTDLYRVKDLSGKMSEKVNTLTQRLQKVNFIQKAGGTIGKFMRVTGIGDFASKLLGIDKVPGAATLNPVELESQLSKNLGKINKALNGSDSDFIDTVKEMARDFISNPKAGLSSIDVTKNIHPEDQKVMSDFIDSARIDKHIPDSTYEMAEKLAERFGISMDKGLKGVANEFEKVLSGGKKVKGTVQTGRPFNQEK